MITALCVGAIVGVVFLGLLWLESSAWAKAWFAVFVALGWPLRSRLRARG